MKYQNINKNKTIGRVVSLENNWQQITINDIRFYKKNNKYYPSVSYILSAYPKGKHMEDWLKKHGTNADSIANEAAEKGTKIHQAIEDMLINKKQLNWIDENGYINYTQQEWQMLMRFCEFWNKYKPKLIASEIHLHSEKHIYAGTVDLVIELNNEL